jgi:hypothetical protein
MEYSGITRLYKDDGYRPTVELIAHGTKTTVQLDSLAMNHPQFKYALELIQKVAQETLARYLTPKSHTAPEDEPTTERSIGLWSNT